MPTFIAEIGVNHNGSRSEALHLIDAAHLAGAQIAKFQLWRKEDKPHLEHLRLSRDDLLACKQHCDTIGIEFCCTPFDIESLGWLARIGVQRIKLASPAMKAPELLLAAAGTGLPLIISTGNCTEVEVQNVRSWIDDDERVTWLHCVSCYPAPLDQLNLLAMFSLPEPFGYSDHSGDATAIIVATALGASVIEMHLTRYLNQDGPDHDSSFTKMGMMECIKLANSVADMLGDGIKRPAPCEVEE